MCKVHNFHTRKPLPERVVDLENEVNKQKWLYRFRVWRKKITDPAKDTYFRALDWMADHPKPGMVMVIVGYLLLAMAIIKVNPS